MAITGIDTLDGKRIIAAGASSAVKAAQDGNGNIITATYQTIAGMSNYQTTWGMTGYATTASVTSKQDALTFSYTDGQISLINGSAIYSQGGGAFPYTGNVQEALDKVYADSATWDNVSAKEDKLTFGYIDGQISQINNSAIYSQGGGGTSYTGNVQEALDKVYTDSASWDNVSAKQDKLTFNYDGSNNITGINSSAIAGGSGVVTATGGDGTYVTSINEMPISGAGGGGSQNVLILTGTQCLTANGGPIYIRKNDSTWKYVTPKGSYFNDPITSDDVLKNAMVVVKEISNGYSSFDLSLDLSGVGSQGLQTGSRYGNSSPFNISGYTAAIPVSSPVTNYNNDNCPCITGVYTLWTGSYVACYTNNSNTFNSAEQLRTGYTHWEVHGFVS